MGLLRSNDDKYKVIDKVWFIATKLIKTHNEELLGENIKAGTNPDISLRLRHFEF